MKWHIIGNNNKLLGQVFGEGNLIEIIKFNYNAVLLRGHWVTNLIIL